MELKGQLTFLSIDYISPGAEGVGWMSLGFSEQAGNLKENRAIVNNSISVSPMLPNLAKYSKSSLDCDSQGKKVMEITLQ